MNLNLNNAAEARDIDALYESLRSNVRVLDQWDLFIVANTRLHEAASTGQTHLAVEIMNLKPSLSRKLNPDGLSPLHLALVNGHFETVKGLIMLNKDLIRIKGRDCLTPLHHAAETEDRVDILVEFLCACPESIQDLNSRGETAPHIATRNHNARALRVLLGWIRKTGWDRVKHMKDRRGNTILHMAVSTSRPDVVHMIVESVIREYRGEGVNEKNLEGDTALDIAESLAPGDNITIIKSSLRGAGALKSSSLANDQSLVDYLLAPFSVKEKLLEFLFFLEEGMPMEFRNVVLVVAVLIATATFQTALSPPDSSSGGGNGLSSSYNSSLFADGSYINATMSISSTSLLPTTNISHVNVTLFTIFTSTDPVFSDDDFPFITLLVLNNVTFLLSIGMIIMVLPFKGFFPLYIALLFLSITFTYATLSDASLLSLSLIFVLFSLPHLLYYASGGPWRKKHHQMLPKPSIEI